MARLFLALLLISLCDPAAAEWVLIGEVPFGRSPLGEYSIHADPATVRRSGDTVSLLFLMNFRTAQVEPAANDGKAYLSQKFHWEFQCRHRQWRTLAYSAHAGPMAGGDVVADERKTTDWQPAPPTTLMEVYWKLACARS